MNILLDTNILGRLAQPTHPMHAAARDAVTTLQRAGEMLRIVPQNLYEFWVIATRPSPSMDWGSRRRRQTPN
jgi:hypothetical protein